MYLARHESGFRLKIWQIYYVDMKHTSYTIQCSPSSKEMHSINRFYEKREAWLKTNGRGFKKGKCSQSIRVWFIIYIFLIIQCSIKALLSTKTFHTYCPISCYFITDISSAESQKIQISSSFKGKQRNENVVWTNRLKKKKTLNIPATFLYYDGYKEKIKMSQ